MEDALRPDTPAQPTSDVEEGPYHHKNLRRNKVFGWLGTLTGYALVLFGTLNADHPYASNALNLYGVYIVAVIVVSSILYTLSLVTLAHDPNSDIYDVLKEVQRSLKARTPFYKWFFGLAEMSCIVLLSFFGHFFLAFFALLGISIQWLVNSYLPTALETADLERSRIKARNSRVRHGTNQ